MSISPIRVLVVDDHPVVRDGLRLMLSVSPGLIWAGQAENGEEAVERSAELGPDVILMDLIMPGMDGATATQIIRKRYPKIQVIALTSFDDKQLIQKALRAGAMSYLLKNASMETITKTIRDAHAGKRTLSSEAIQALVAENQGEADTEITPRELEILMLMAEGLKNADIAGKLYISEATVRFHVGNILRKLGAANRTQAARMAIERGLIQ